MKGPTPPIERKTLTLSEVADLLGIARSTVYQLAAQDRLPVPTIRLGRRMVVSRSAIDEQLSRRKLNEQSEERGDR
jgi:excisionase family DNA binding protein